MTIWRWSALLVLTALAMDARAQGSTPIVYSARYYTAATSKTKSHFHLYRINPDGSGKRQITFGDVDDLLPAWSPDGKRIAFWRGNTIWLVNADGRNLHAFYKAGTESYYIRRWMPDSKSMTVTDPDGKAVLVSVVTGKATPCSSPAPAVCLEAEEIESGVVLKKTLTDGTKKELLLTFTASLAKRIDAGDFEAGYWRVGPSLPKNGALLLWQSTGDSTQGHWYHFFRVDESAKTIAYLTDGGTLSWSPDGRRFVTTFGRELAPLGKGDTRQVWVSTLTLGTMAKDGTVTTRSLVSGLVDMGSSDWRGGERTIIP